MEDKVKGMQAIETHKQQPLMGQGEAVEERIIQEHQGEEAVETE
jgi:hypothetical protein